jgi:hypothetical protein
VVWNKYHDSNAYDATTNGCNVKTNYQLTVPGATAHTGIKKEGVNSNVNRLITLKHRKNILRCYEEKNTRGEQKMARTNIFGEEDSFIADCEEGLSNVFGYGRTKKEPAQEVEDDYELESSEEEDY